jgi:hypothetical protein
VEGDSELIVNQVTMKCEARNQRLKRYRHVVWDEIECFDAFNISHIDRTLNEKADSLATTATLFTPWMTDPYITHIVEVSFRPHVLNNIGSWQVFEDDRHILNFLNSTNEFANHNIDEIQEGEEIPMIQVKSNKIPKGLVPLEQLFDRSDTFQGTNKSSLDDQVQEVNIGNGDTPRIIKIGKACTLEEKSKIIALVREYRDVFAWCYDELKAYDLKIINHAIPLLEDVKPFRPHAVEDDEPPTKLTKEEIEDYVLFSTLLGFVIPGEDTWLIDSGASKHMAGQRDILSRLTEKNFPQKVTLEDDYQYPIKGVGESTYKLDSRTLMRM